jgi:hypothetical protein
MSSKDVEATAGESQPLLKDRNGNESSTKGTPTLPTNDDKSTISSDVHDTIMLGIPIFFSMLSWVGMKTTDSALLGHVSAQALSAAALSDLVRQDNGFVLCVCASS